MALDNSQLERASQQDIITLRLKVDHMTRNIDLTTKDFRESVQRLEQHWAATSESIEKETKARSEETQVLQSTCTDLYATIEDCMQVLSKVVEKERDEREAELSKIRWNFLPFSEKIAEKIADDLAASSMDKIDSLHEIGLPKERANQLQDIVEKIMNVIKDDMRQHCSRSGVEVKVATKDQVDTLQKQLQVICHRTTGSTEVGLDSGVDAHLQDSDDGFCCQMEAPDRNEYTSALSDLLSRARSADNISRDFGVRTNMESFLPLTEGNSHCNTPVNEESGVWKMYKRSLSSNTGSVNMDCEDLVQSPTRRENGSGLPPSLSRRREPRRAVSYSGRSGQSMDACSYDLQDSRVSLLAEAPRGRGVAMGTERSMSAPPCQDQFENLPDDVDPILHSDIPTMLDASTCQMPLVFKKEHSDTLPNDGDPTLNSNIARLLEGTDADQMRMVFKKALQELILKDGQGWRRGKAAPYNELSNCTRPVPRPPIRRSRTVSSSLAMTQQQQQQRVTGPASLSSSLSWAPRGAQSLTSNSLTPNNRSSQTLDVPAGRADNTGYLREVSPGSTSLLGSVNTLLGSSRAPVPVVSTASAQPPPTLDGVAPQLPTRRLTQSPRLLSGRATPLSPLPQCMQHLYQPSRTMQPPSIPAFPGRFAPVNVAFHGSHT